jgi:prepilin-type N-terminal cleavage/methylation domain-containing protein
MKKLRSLAFTLIELLVVISIIGILVTLVLPGVTGAIARAQMTQSLSNMKQLHLVSQQMALDATTTGDTNVGWPGDLPTKTWAYWSEQITGGYMSTNDFMKMVSAPGITAPPGGNPGTLSPGQKNGRALLLYPVSETNDTSFVLFSTANFTNTAGGGSRPDKAALPFGEKGFVVFRKGGDGAILQARQTGTTFTNIIGGSAGTPLN